MLFILQRSRIMPSIVNLDAPLEAAVDRLVKAGRYETRSDVLREGVRLIEDREAQLAKLNASIAQGVEDIRVGRFRPVEEVFDELDARFAAMTERRRA
jgi:antitoxin ParD1/3/4